MSKPTALPQDHCKEFTCIFTKRATVAASYMKSQTRGEILFLAMKEVGEIRKVSTIFACTCVTGRGRGFTMYLEASSESMAAGGS